MVKWGKCVRHISRQSDVVRNGVAVDIFGRVLYVDILENHLNPVLFV